MTSIDDGIETYYAVPLIPNNENDRVVPCNYYNYDDDHKRWINMESRPLTSNGQNGNAGLIRIAQFTAVPLDIPINPGHTLDPQSILFAAIAKTIGNTYDLPNTFVSVPGGPGSAYLRSIVIPLFVQSSRSVILVFSKNDMLTATGDPEIATSSNKRQL